jgi:hypothetical protein
MRWDLLKAIHETRSLFLLYHAPNRAVVLPKRFFASPEELKGWRDFASRHVDAKRMHPPGLACMSHTRISAVGEEQAEAPATHVPQALRPALTCFRV